MGVLLSINNDIDDCVQRLIWPFCDHRCDIVHPARCFTMSSQLRKSADGRNPPRGQCESKPILTYNKDSDEFRICLDVIQFQAEELSVKVIDEYILIEGEHDMRQDEYGQISRRFTRRHKIPPDYDISKMDTTLSSDGILMIVIPKIKKERIVKIQKTGPANFCVDENKQCSCCSPTGCAICAPTTLKEQKYIPSSQPIEPESEPEVLPPPKPERQSCSCPRKCQQQTCCSCSSQKPQICTIKTSKKDEAHRQICCLVKKEEPHKSSKHRRKSPPSKKSCSPSRSSRNQEDSD